MSRELWKESLWNYDKDQMLKCWRKLQEGRGSYRLYSEGSTTHEARSQALSLVSLSPRKLLRSFICAMHICTYLTGDTQESAKMMSSSAYFSVSLDISSLFENKRFFLKIQIILLWKTNFTTSCAFPEIYAMSKEYDTHHTHSWGWLVVLLLVSMGKD